MRIKTLCIEGFRCFSNASLDFAPKLTVMVGENGTGKSTIGLALEKLLMQCKLDVDQIDHSDYPYGVRGPVKVQAVLGLSEQELNNGPIARLIPDATPEPPKDTRQRGRSSSAYPAGQPDRS